MTMKQEKRIYLGAGRLVVLLALIPEALASSSVRSGAIYDNSRTSPTSGSSARDIYATTIAEVHIMLVQMAARFILNCSPNLRRCPRWRYTRSRSVFIAALPVFLRLAPSIGAEERHLPLLEDRLLASSSASRSLWPADQRFNLWYGFTVTSSTFTAVTDSGVATVLAFEITIILLPSTPPMAFVPSVTLPSLRASICQPAYELLSSALSAGIGARLPYTAWSPSNSA